MVVRKPTPSRFRSLSPKRSLTKSLSPKRSLTKSLSLKRPSSAPVQFNHNTGSSLNKDVVILALDYDKCVSDMYKDWGDDKVNRAMQKAFKNKIEGITGKNVRYKIVGFSNRQSKTLCNAQNTKYTTFIKNFKELNELMNGYTNINNRSLFLLKNENNIRKRNLQVLHLQSKRKPKTARKQLNTINKADIAQKIMQRYTKNKVIFVDDKIENLKRAHSVYGNKADYLQMILHKTYPEARMAGKVTNSQYYEDNGIFQIDPFA